MKYVLMSVLCSCFLVVSSAVADSRTVVFVSCKVPALRMFTDILQRGIRQRIQEQHPEFGRVRVSVRFRPLVRNERFQVPVEELLNQFDLISDGNLRYELNDIAQPEVCTILYDVIIRVSATSFEDFSDFDDFGDRPNSSGNRITFQETSFSQVELEGIVMR